MHVQTVRCRIDRCGDAGEMPAHEKRIVRRERSAVEYLERRLKLHGPGRENDQIAFLWIRREGASAVCKRQRDRSCASRGGWPLRQAKAARNGGCPGDKSLPR